MSGSISGTWYGASPPLSAGRLIGDNARLRAATDVLTAQASSGKIAKTFGGLAGGARVAVNLAPVLARQDVFAANIAEAGTRLEASQAAFDQLGAIASKFAAGLTGVNEGTAGALNGLATEARAALGQVADILNTQVNGAYLFGGADPATPPVQSGATIAGSAFATQIGTALASLGAAGGPATIAASLAAALANGPALFSAAIGTQPPEVEIGEGQFVGQGVLAGVNLAGPSTGATSTGAYATDLMRALASIAGMSSGQATLAGFGAVRQDIIAGLRGAGAAITADQAMLGASQAALTGASSRLDATKALLQKRLSAATDVDMAETAARLASTQTQLQASYKLIAGMRDLSLVNFL